MSDTMTSNAIDRIKQDLTSNDVVLFMKGTPNFPQCGFSGQVAKILAYLEVPYKGVNVLEDMEIREGVKQYANWPTIPQLYIKGEFVGGCDIVREMFQSRRADRSTQGCRRSGQGPAPACSTITFCAAAWSQSQGVGAVPFGGAGHDADLAAVPANQESCRQADQFAGLLQGLKGFGRGVGIKARFFAPISCKKALGRSSRARVDIHRDDAKIVVAGKALKAVRPGISSRQGTHQVAQRFSSTSGP